MADPAYPLDYVPPYSPDDILRRFQFLSLRCRAYVDRMNHAHPTWRLGFDHLVMLSIAQSALDDIWRFKVYHLRDPEKLSDAVKRAAYWTKWIVRFRPIYFDRISPSEDPDAENFDMNDTSLMVNEGFAIHISKATIASELGAKAIVLDQEFYPNFLYDLHYRELSEDALLSHYHIIRSAAEGRSVVARTIPR